MALVKVMLVDADVGFVEATGRRLATRGLEVVRAFSGQEALDRLAAEEDIDIVILGVCGPNKEGTDVLRRIKASHPLVEIILVADQKAVDIAIHGMRLGAYDFIMKPFDMDQLTAKVAEAEARKAAQEEKILSALMRRITLDGSL
jgi:DNA-binding NtrC family response regulator